MVRRGFALFVALGLAGAGATASAEGPSPRVPVSGEIQVEPDQTQDLLLGDAAQRVVVHVAIDAGRVEVQSVRGDRTEVLGEVGEGQVCAFDGEFLGVRVRGLGSKRSTGRYEDRAPPESSEPEAALASGTLTASEVPTLFYRCAAPALRWTEVSAAEGNVEVRTLREGPVIASIGRGSEGWTSQSCAELWVVGQGKFSFRVRELDPTRPPRSRGTVRSTGPASAAVLVMDGSVCVRATLSNTGDGIVKVRVEDADGHETEQDLSPGTSMPLGACRVTRWRFEFEHTDGVLAWEVAPDGPSQG